MSHVPSETYQVVTANRLADGLVVFLTASGAWSERYADAARFDAATAETEVARATTQSTLVVGAYAVEVDADGPLRVRERIRALGPSVGPSAVRADAARRHAA